MTTLLAILINTLIGSFIFIRYDYGGIWGWCRQGWAPVRIVIATTFWPIALYLQWRNGR